MSRAERLSDAYVDMFLNNHAKAGEAFADEVQAMARELRERRDAEHACGCRCQTCLDAERAVAPAVENPYRFKVEVASAHGAWGLFVVDVSDDDDDSYRGYEEACTAAALIAAALRNVEVDVTFQYKGAVSDAWRIHNGHYTPTVTRNDDGTLTLDWPDGTPDTCIMSKHLLAEMVEQQSIVSALRARHNVTLDGIVALVDSVFDPANDSCNDEWTEYQPRFTYENSEPKHVGPKKYSEEWMELRRAARGDV